MAVSLLALTGLGLTIACLSAATSPVFDPDVHWLAAAGRSLLANGRVPDRNIFSFTAPHHLWLMHEWLLSPLYAWLLSTWGESALPLIALTAAVAMAAMQLQLSLGRGAYTFASLLVALFTVGVFALLMASPRPTVVARLFPVGLLLLATSARFTWRHTLMVTLLECVWANAHGSFPLGLALLAVGALDATADRRQRWLATATASAATFLNPAGYRLHVLAFDYLTGRDPTLRLVHQHVREFRPAYVLLEDPWPFFELGGLMVVFLLALSALLRRRHLARASLALVLCVMGAMQARHVMLAILLGAPLLLPEVASLLGTRLRHVTLPSTSATAALLLLPASLMSIGAWTLQRSEQDASAWVHTSLGGRAFAELAQRIPDGAHVYTHFGVAGRLIWLGAPRGVRVFYDSRNDCYPPEVVREAFELADAEVDAARALSVLDTRGTDYAFIGPFGGLGVILEHSDEWHAVAEEGSWRLFARSSARTGH